MKCNYFGFLDTAIANLPSFLANGFKTINIMSLKGLSMMQERDDTAALLYITVL